jgi:hypothetical protein
MVGEIAKQALETQTSPAYDAESGPGKFEVPGTHDIERTDDGPTGFDVKEVGKLSDIEADITPVRKDAAAEAVDPDSLDYQELYNGAVAGLDKYDFDGVVLNEEPEELACVCGKFDEGNWEGMNLDEKKETIDNLSDCIKESIGFENPPEVVFYNTEEYRNYSGYYDPATNKVYINEYMLGDAKETVATIAHELWHAHQYECAEHLKCKKDYQYQIGLSQDVYITPEEDYDGYRNQLVEAEAFAFEEYIKEGLDQAKGMV